MDQQGSLWTLQFTGETKALHKEDARPWLQGRSGAGAHSWPWQGKVGREGLQLWGSAGAYRVLVAPIILAAAPHGAHVVLRVHGDGERS